MPHLRAREARGPRAVFVRTTLVLTLLGATPAFSSPVLANSACDLYASTGGDDSNVGTTPDTALRNIRTLVPRLQPGQVGCLVGPTFVQEWDGWGSIASGGGTVDVPVTITSAGSTPTRYFGPLVIEEAAHDLVIRDLQFVGAPSPGQDHGWTHIQINGDRVKILNNDISDRMGICIGAGADVAIATDLVIEGNRIHDCGRDIVNWEPGESGVHAVYIINTERTRIANNYIYDAINRGIQLYPNAIDSLVESNVLDGNGANLNIGSDPSSGYFSRGSIVRDNIISNSELRSVYNPPPNFSKGDDVQINGNYPVDATDTEYGNSVTENCIYQLDPSKNFGGSGYVRSPNTFADPQYVDRANNDFSLQADSPCRAYGPRTAVTPPAPEATNYERSLSLGLRRHLVARGLVTTSDGLPGCVSGREVMIQKRVNGLWRPIKSTFTDQYGSFKVRLPDRLGKYRASVVQESVGEAFCLAAVSPGRVHRH